MKEYVDFWEITSGALDYAMEVLNIENNKLRDQLLELYLKLEAYPEVKKVLEKLKDKKYKTGILSNGSKSRQDVSMAKIHVAETLNNVSDTAIQLNGAKGYSKDIILEWIYRYARQAKLVDGASEVHQMIINRFFNSQKSNFWHWGIGHDTQYYITWSILSNDFTIAYGLPGNLSNFPSNLLTQIVLKP